MKLIRKISAIVMVLCIVIGNINFIYAENLNDNEKVEILQELKILKGNGVSLDLNSQLSRSEAAAFIVRLVCQEEEVLDNKLKYIDTRFSDVSMDKWYAPYIGYCVEEGIIDGYSDNTFRPNDKLGEKAFLKLVLTAMGYKYNEDFTWNNVFELAYGIGLVKSPSYANGYIEDAHYTRGKVAEVLYTALGLKDPRTKIRMMQKFVENRVVTKEQAISYNLLDDELETKIQSITSLSPTTIEVKFNEKVQEFTADDILLYETDDASEVFSIKDIEKKGSTDTYIIKTTQKQEMYEDYTVLIDKVVDLKGNPAYSSSNSFLGYREDEIESDFFRISKVEPVSNNVINVYYTQPINDNALKASFYSIEQDEDLIIKGDNSNMLINKLPTCDNGITIYLKNYFFTTQDLFLLKVDGQLSSLYGVRLNNEEGDFVKFKGRTTPNQPFSVLECEALNENTIQLVFNKEVNTVIASQIYMYSVQDKNGSPIQITKALVVKEYDFAGRAVRLTTSSDIEEKEEYTVMINYLSDVTRQFFINEKKYSLITEEYDSQEIDVMEVSPIDANTLAVYITVPLDQEYAENVDNFQIKGVSNVKYKVKPAGIYYNKKEDPHELKIYLPKDKALEKYDRYLFRLFSMKDAMGNIQLSGRDKEFKYKGSENAEIYIDEAKIIGTNTVKITFNKEIAFDITNVMTSNYTITYTENGFEYPQMPISANYIDPTTVILTFDILDTEKEYTITFDKLIDYGNNETVNDDDKYSIPVIVGEQ